MAKKILVVDDEPGVRMILSLKLEDRGYEVLTAEDGAEAVRLAGEKMPDLILLDLNMPGMDGSEAAMELKDNEVTKKIPVIFLTALVSPEEVSSEAHSMIYAKSNDFSLLMDKIREVVGK